MTRRRRLRRRLLWAGVLLGLVLVVALLSVLEAGLRVRDHVVSASRFRHTKRREKTMSRTTALAVLTSLVALVIMVTPASADRWGADGPIVDRVLAAAPTPERFERYASAHAPREPVVDDHFRIDPTDTDAQVAREGEADIPWRQVGIGLGLGGALVLALYLATRRMQRPHAAP